MNEDQSVGGHTPNRGIPAPSSRRWRAAFLVAVAAIVGLSGALAVAANQDPVVRRIPVPLAPTARPPASSTPTPADVAPVTTTTTVPQPLRVMTVGDSVMLQLGEGLQLYAADHPDEITAFNEAELGCVIARYGSKRLEGSADGPVGTNCSGWADPVPSETINDKGVVSWVTATELFRPDVVLIYATPWDVNDRLVPSLGDEWTHIGKVDFDQYLRDEYNLAIDTLTAAGARVYWLESAALNQPVVAQNSPERIAALNALIHEEFDDDPRVGFIDYPGFLGPVGADRDSRLRPDGVHISFDHLDEAVGFILGEIDR